ncbi:MAG: flagellar basal body P-ring formation chaperone FlgA [Pseudomonadota bacterium]
MRAHALAAALGGFFAGPACAAETLYATRTIPARAIIAPGDVVLRSPDVPGALTDASLAIGYEAQIVIYAGRPLRARDLAPPALVERNDIVTLTYRAGTLEIIAEGRALGRGPEGARIPVMNLASRTTVTATVIGPSHLRVGE